MFRLDTFQIHGSVRNGGRLGAALMLALSLALTLGPIGDLRAENGAAEQDPTARPLIKLVPRGATRDAGAILPRRRILERRPVGVIERLNLTGLAESAERTLSEVAATVRDGADKALNWWNRDSEANKSLDKRRRIGAPLPPRSKLMAPISVSPAQQRVREVWDPFEPVNRLVFGINSTLQVHVFHPFTDLYYEYTTRGVRLSVRQFFSNLREPVTIVSSAFAGNLRDAGNATARFGINTTLGVVGLFDPATGMGFSRRPHDLEEALCQYGLPTGPYVVLPLLGPATVRDSVGRLLTVAAYFQVMGASIYVPYRVSDLAVSYADIREEIWRLNAGALDPYAVHRRTYITRRNKNCGRLKAIPLGDFRD